MYLVLRSTILHFFPAYLARRSGQSFRLTGLPPRLLSTTSRARASPYPEGKHKPERMQPTEQLQPHTAKRLRLLRLLRLLPRSSATRPQASSSACHAWLQTLLPAAITPRPHTTELVGAASSLSPLPLRAYLVELAIVLVLRQELARLHLRLIESLRLEHCAHLRVVADGRAGGQQGNATERYGYARCASQALHCAS